MSDVLIFHGTEGYPEENWFPWLKGELEKLGCKVAVPHFPSPPIVPAKIAEWFDVLKNYAINENTIIVGHSLGGVFALRVLEKLEKPIKGVILVGAPVGEKPILNYDRDVAFCGFNFDWKKIKQMAKHFMVFQSDDDPYVGFSNGEKLANELGVGMTFIPNAGHFNKKAGYLEFPEVLDIIKVLINSKVIFDYSGNLIEYKSDCPACAYVKKEFSIPCGLAYEDDVCTVSQDWEIPINGFFVVAPKRHLTLLEQMTEQERNHIFTIVNRVIAVLRKNQVADDFNVIFEEKRNTHFHIWILPRDGFEELGINPTKDIDGLFKYALSSLQTKENMEKIKMTNLILKRELM